jgi:hypothetical protein
MAQEKHLSAKQPQFDDILKLAGKMPTAADFPDADAVIIEQAVRIRLQKDGRVVKTQRTVQTLLTDYSHDIYADIHIPYDVTSQKVNLVTARTWMRDHSAVDTPKYGVNEITPPAIQLAPFYQDVRERIVSLVGTEVGSTTMIEYEVEDTKRRQDHLEGVEHLQDERPIMKKEFVIEVPSGTKLHWGSINKAPAPKVEQGKPFDTYTWSVAEMPLAAGDEKAPQYRHLLPAIVYSTAASWDDLAANESRKLAKLVKTSKEIEKKVGDILKKDPLAPDSAWAIHKFVMEGVRLVEWAHHRNGFLSRTAAEVYNNAYGNPFDKAVLLVSMLNAAGFTARMAYAADTMVTAKGVPALGQLNKPLVAFDTKCCTMLLDPTRKPGEFKAEDLAELTVLTLSEKGHSIEQYPASSPEENSSLVRATVSVKDDLSAQGELNVQVGGAFCAFHGFRETDDDKIDGAMKGIPGKLFPGAECTSHRMIWMKPDRCHCKFTFKIGRLVETPDHQFTFTVPLALRALHGIDPAVHRSSRATVLALRAAVEGKFEFELTVPKDSLAVVYAPEKGSVKHAAAKCELAVDKADDKITIRQECAFPKKMVLPGEYKGLREVMEKLSSPAWTQILLERK